MSWQAPSFRVQSRMVVMRDEARMRGSDQQDERAVTGVADAGG